MKLSKFLLLILFFLLELSSYAQPKGYSLERIVPPSPTAASLGAYGDIPLNYYTGQANINIPLYQIKTSQHQLEIDLNYNSNIRVNQDASWVGLGWSLNAGGVITRVVRGIDDFDNPDDTTMGQGYYYAPAIPEPDYNPEDDPMDTGIYKTFYVNGDIYGQTDPDAVFFRKALEGRIDTEPDIFYYNFAGYTGSFVLGKQADGSVVYLRNFKDELKIEIDHNSTEYGSWTITTPDGYVYHFATVETSENLLAKINLHESEMEGLGPYTGQIVDPGTPWTGTYAFKRNVYDKLYATAWYMDYIEAPNGERITFSYADYYGETLSNINVSQTRYDKIQDLYLASPGSNGSCESWPSSYSSVISNTQASRQIIQNVYLDKITFENGHIEFITDERKDIERYNGNGPQKLSEIRVYTGNKRIKNITFGHDYFNTNSQNSTGNNLRYTMCRLKLESITEAGKSPWEFEYYNPNSLPSKYSKKVDDWGFYNPNIYVKSIGDLYWSTHSPAPTWLPEVEYNGDIYPGTTRKPDETGTSSRKGMLKRITYPTKGYTDFEYEPNTIRLGTPETIETFESIGSVRNTGNFDNYNDVFEDDFYASSDEYILSFWSYPTYADPPVSPDVALAWLKDNQGNILETFYLTDPENTVEKRNVTLSSGRYILEAKPLADHEIRLSLGKTVTSYKYHKTVGGLRVAKITNHDSNDNVLSLKKYIYTENGTETGRGTGRLLETHRKYEYTEQKKYWQSPCNPAMEPDYWSLEASAGFLKRTSYTLYPMGFNSPNGIVGYRTVYELSDEEGQLGMTRYEFGRDLPKTYNSNHYADFLNLGDISNVTQYDADREPVAKTSSSYLTKKLSYLYGIDLTRLTHLENPCPLCPLDDPVGGYPIPYYLDWSEWYVRDQVITTQYDSGQTLEKIEKFHYDHPLHKQLTSKNVLSSEGHELQTIYKYPYDFTSNTVYQQMVNHHILSPAIEENTVKDGVSLMNKKTSYEHLGGKIYRPVSIESKKRGGSIDSRIQYAYDSKGNLLESNKTNGSHNYYVWGYRKQYPIAKIENFDTDKDMTPDIEELMSSAQSASNSDNGQSNDENVLRKALEDLRNALPAGAVMSSYTYDPHIGMTSMTDPAGYTVYYKYDAYNRLKYLKDAEGNILSENKYHYKD